VKNKIDSASIYHAKDEKPKVDTLNKNRASEKKPQAPIPDKTEYYFCVQILTSPTQLQTGDAKFKGIKNAKEVFENSLYKYLVGKFSSFSEGVAMQAKMREHGFKDCFVVAYKDGKRITVSEARKEMK